MKCYDFETNITELLNGKLEESKRREVLTHAMACKKCEDVLYEQQRLNLELETFASGQSSDQLPPEIEQRLISAFRAQSAGMKSPSRRASASSPITFLQSFNLRNRWLFATAAVSLALGSLAIYSLLHRPAISPVKTVSSSQMTEPMELQYETKASETAIVAGNPVLKTETKQVPIIHRTRSQSRRSGVLDRVEWITAEVATDFYAIPYVQLFGPNDRVRVVRTQVPHSMLADFGLPVFSDQAFYPVQADVMVGDDNIARAIRFVQQWRLPRNASRPSAHETIN
jgi:hypothetical protein